MKPGASNRAVSMGKAGFTLIEVLLVVVILGILAAIVVPNFVGRGEEARISAARSSILAIEKAAELFQLDVGRAPNSLDELITQPSGARNWNGPIFAGACRP
jgi:general secretion pathway protein G